MMQAQAIAMTGMLFCSDESADIFLICDVRLEPAEFTIFVRQLFSISARLENVLATRILTTGGTFDKVYFDAKSEFHFGDPIVGNLLTESHISSSYVVESLMQKDSLDMDDQDREQIRTAVERSSEKQILIIHGTDTMVETARSLGQPSDKTVVLFGAMQPARMRYSDAMFNLGFAMAAVQLLPTGVYLAMNGEVFDPAQVVKNQSLSRFETIQ